MRKLEEILESLKQSPVFNMSLGSKELFHSNFIAWMIDAEAIDSKDFLIHLLPEPESRQIPSRHIKSVDREVRNFDIRVWFNDGHNILFENKLKSIPYKEQLEKYSQSLCKEKDTDISKTICILLSLTEPDFFTNGVYIYNLRIKWLYISYEQLKSVLENSKVLGPPYHQELIRDYCEFIGILSQLKKACISSWHQIPTLLEYQNPDYKLLQKFRLHDIYEKWRMSEIRKRIEDQSIGDVDFEVGYTNGNGLLHIAPARHEYRRDYFLSVQVQGNQLRQVLQINKIKDNDNHYDIFKKADDLLTQGKWFREKSGAELPKIKSSKADKRQKGFCKYGPTFAYRHEVLSDLDRIVELIRIMKENTQKEERKGDAHCVP